VIEDDAVAEPANHIIDERARLLPGRRHARGAHDAS
jgi:hypothetical protein